MEEPVATGALARLRWPLIVGLPLLAVALAYTLFTPQYQTNDDVGMTMLAAGVGLGPEPSPYLLFIHPLLGQFLSSLYRVCPEVAWYTLFLTLLRILSGVVLGVAILGRRPSAVRAALLTGYFLLVDLPCHVCPQFSLVAAGAAQAAVVLWLSRGPQRPWSGASLATFLGLLALAVMLRPDHAVLIVLLATPLLAVDAMLTLRRGAAHPATLFRVRLWAWAGRTGLPFLVAVTLGLVLQRYQQWFYATSPGWEDFYAYNYLRGMCTDFGREDSKPISDEALARVGWSRNDLAMLKTFFFADREHYAPAKLQAYLKERAIQPLSVRASLRTRAKHFWAYPVLRLFLAAGLFPALFLTRGGWLRHAVVCLAVLLVWVLAAGVAGHYCPYHFLMSMLGFAAAVGVALAQPVRLGAVRLTAWAAGAAVLTTAVIQGTGYLQQRSVAVAAASTELWKEVRALGPRADQLYVVWGGCFPYEYLLPFDSMTALSDFKIFPFGCAANTPLTDQRLRQFGLSDLVTALYSRDNVFLVCVDGLLPLMETYLAEHYGVRVEAKPIFDPPGRLFKVFQLRPVLPLTPSPGGG